MQTQLQHLQVQMKNLPPETLLAQVQQIQKLMAQLPSATNHDQQLKYHHLNSALNQLVQNNYSPNSQQFATQLEAIQKEIQELANITSPIETPINNAGTIVPSHQQEKKTQHIAWEKILVIIAFGIVGYYVFLLFGKKDKIARVIYEEKVKNQASDEILDQLKSVKSPMYREGVIKTYRLYHQLLEKNFFLPGHAPPPHSAHLQVFGEYEMQQPQLPALCEIVNQVIYNHATIDKKTWQNYEKLLILALKKLRPIEDTKNSVALLGNLNSPEKILSKSKSQ